MAGGLLTEAQMEKLTKPQVIQYCLKIQDVMREQLEKALERSEKNSAHIDALSKRVEKLESHQAVSHAVIRSLSSQIHRNDQYSRKDTLEVHGVEEDVGDGDVLEEKICELLSQTGEDVSPADLHACHRLSNKSMVICKFKCRKKKYAVISKRKNVQDPQQQKQGGWAREAEEERGTRIRKDLEQWEPLSSLQVDGVEVPDVTETKTCTLVLVFQWPPPY